MSTFAHITNDTVDRVIVADKAFIDSGAVGDGWVECPENEVSIGYTIDRQGHFIEPKPFPSWELREGKWEAPKVRPAPTAQHRVTKWNEGKQEWEEVHTVRCACDTCKQLGRNVCPVYEEIRSK